jgi:hypothetical protein
MRPASSAVADSTVHGKTLCTASVCAEDFLLPDCVLELALGLALEPELVPEPVLLLPATVIWPEISVDKKREFEPSLQTDNSGGLRRTLLERR